MVARTIVTVFDDLDNPEGATTVTFAYRGTSYEIDLGEKNQAALDKALAKFIAAARPSSQTRLAGGRKRSDVKLGTRAELATIRAWAREHGFEVSDRGRVSSEIREAYDAAH
jgi:hypothetical protein